MSSDDRTLLARYGSRIYRLAYGITCSSADAEEVVQDVFLQVIRPPHAFALAAYPECGCPCPTGQTRRTTCIEA